MYDCVFVRAGGSDIPREAILLLFLQVKSDKWEGMYVDLLPGDEVKAGSVIKAEIENPDPVPVCSICLRHRHDELNMCLVGCHFSCEGTTRISSVFKQSNIFTEDVEYGGKCTA